MKNALDELFALQQQTKEDHQKFLVESATLIKSSHKQVNDSHQTAVRAEKAARESAEASKNTSRIACAAHDG